LPFSPPPAACPAHSSAANRLARHFRKLGAALDEKGYVTKECLRPLLASELFAVALERKRDTVFHLNLLKTLTVLGSGDLSIGRLFEGHVNACLLVMQYGSEAQQRCLASYVGEGNLLGVWCADGAEPLRLRPKVGGYCLTGSKVFASGAGVVSSALLIAWDPSEGRQMVLLPIDSACRIDGTSWQPLGMRASMSFTVDFTNVAVSDAELVGAPGDYFCEPWFTAGAIRFGAVQLGGALAIARLVHRYLREARRHEDHHQIQRMAHVWIAMRNARLQLDAATSLDTEADPSDVLLKVNAARSTVEETCGRVMDLAVKAVGLQGLLAPHPLERLVRDLTTYLRQPLPDAAFMSVGKRILERTCLPW
jgi:alkylation response protein AidB-like acyl-CoA dehydrogenase